MVALTEDRDRAEQTGPAMSTRPQSTRPKLETVRPKPKTRQIHWLWL